MLLIRRKVKIFWLIKSPFDEAKCYLHIPTSVLFKVSGRSLAALKATCWLRDLDKHAACGNAADASMAPPREPTATPMKLCLNNASNPNHRHYNNINIRCARVFASYKSATANKMTEHTSERIGSFHHDNTQTHNINCITKYRLLPVPALRIRAGGKTAEPCPNEAMLCGQMFLKKQVAGAVPGISIAVD